MLNEPKSKDVYKRQDNTSVILSDVQTMQDDIKSTLEEEASLITDWDISLKMCIRDRADAVWLMPISARISCRLRSVAR